MSKLRQMSYSFALLFLVTLMAPNSLYAATFFADDFEGESGVGSGPNPVWSWRTPYAKGTNSFGMMLGEKDIYSVSDTVVNSGRKSLRINFNGRNDFCNICGSTSHIVTASDLSGGCISTSNGATENFIHNKSDAFSQWKMSSGNSSQICLDLSKPLKGPVSGGSASIRVGDEIKIPRKCGVNGNVGGNKGRRSDCDLAINYLNGIQKSHFDYGKTLSRRMYVYIPAATTIPSVTIKLGYAKFERSSIVPFVSSGRNARFEIDGNAILGFIQTDLFFERNKWMYIEEVYTRETSSGANNGKFLLYAGYSEDDKTKPILTANNLTFGALKDLSIIGNWPHFNHASGYMYVDDVTVSDQYIGPIEGGAVSRPRPPGDINISISK